MVLNSRNNVCQPICCCAHNGTWVFSTENLHSNEFPAAVYHFPASSARVLAYLFPPWQYIIPTHSDYMAVLSELSSAR